MDGGGVVVGGAATARVTFGLKALVGGAAVLVVVPVVVVANVPRVGAGRGAGRGVAVRGTDGADVVEGVGGQMVDGEMVTKA